VTNTDAASGSRDLAQTEAGHSRIFDFQDAWSAKASMSFGDWVALVAKTFYESRLTLEGAARRVRATSAELQAVLSLAGLEDDDLQLLSKAAPAKTTWFLFAGANPEGVRAGVEALQEANPGESPFAIVDQAIHDVMGPDSMERVAALPGRVLGHMSTKAKQYDLLYPKARSFLVNMSKSKTAGRTLTQKQVGYLHDVLSMLVDGGAITRSSPDGDQEMCDAVLDALGQ
jgi:hypothetical protein